VLIFAVMPIKPQPKIKTVSFKYKPKTIDSRYNTTAWRKLRALIIQENPICNNCKRKAASVADHVQPVRLNGEFWNYDNLQALCASCHNSKSAKESKL
jgi:5-methylcytosine-specific restriction protein A